MRCFGRVYDGKRTAPASRDGLNENDRRQLRLATLLDTKTCGLLRPKGEPRVSRGEVPDDPVIGFQRITDQLEAHGITVHTLDLTRPDFEVPVARVLAPAPHSMRRTNAAQIYKKTGNLRAVQLLLGHTKLESTVRYLGIEVDDALEIAEQTEE